MAKEWFGVAWLQDAPIRASHMQAFSISEDPKAKKRVGIANSRTITDMFVLSG